MSTAIDGPDESIIVFQDDIPDISMDFLNCDESIVDLSMMDHEAPSIVFQDGVFTSQLNLWEDGDEEESIFLDLEQSVMVDEEMSKLMALDDVAQPVDEPQAVYRTLGASRSVSTYKLQEEMVKLTEFEMNQSLHYDPRIAGFDVFDDSMPLAPMTIPSTHRELNLPNMSGMDMEDESIAPEMPGEECVDITLTENAFIPPITLPNDKEMKVDITIEEALPLMPPPTLLHDEDVDSDVSMEEECSIIVTRGDEEADTPPIYENSILPLDEHPIIDGYDMVDMSLSIIEGGIDMEMGDIEEVELSPIDPIADEEEGNSIVHTIVEEEVAPVEEEEGTVEEELVAHVEVEESPIDTKVEASLVDAITEEEVVPLEEEDAIEEEVAPVEEEVAFSPIDTKVEEEITQESPIEALPIDTLGESHSPLEERSLEEMVEEERGVERGRQIVLLQSLIRGYLARKQLEILKQQKFKRLQTMQQRLIRNQRGRVDLELDMKGLETRFASKIEAILRQQGPQTLSKRRRDLAARMQRIKEIQDNRERLLEEQQKVGALSRMPLQDFFRQLDPVASKVRLESTIEKRRAKMFGQGREEVKPKVSRRKSRRSFSCINDVNKEKDKVRSRRRSMVPQSRELEKMPAAPTFPSHENSMPVATPPNRRRLPPMFNSIDRNGRPRGKRKGVRWADAVEGSLVQPPQIHSPHHMLVQPEQLKSSLLARNA